MIDRVAIKQQARQINKDAKVNAFAFTLLYIVIVLALGALDTLATGGQVQELIDMYTDMGIEIPFTLPTLPLPAMAAGFIGIAATLLTTVLGAGYDIYHLGIRRRMQMDYASLFDGFTFVGKVILLSLVMELFISLWTLLFFFPGIIAAYRYRFAFYNLCSDPDMGIMEAIRLSCQQTSGYKGQLFVLDLSFLGWFLLSLLTAGVLTIYLLPYRTQADVGYYYAILERKGMAVPGGDLYRTPENTPDF